MDNLVQLYNDINDSDNQSFWLQAYLRHWLISILEFDSRTFEPTTMTLTEFCQKSLDIKEDLKIENHDFLYHIAINILGNSLNLLLPNLNTKIVREHEIMPLVNAREFDRVCMRWVARKSGRNLKEKLVLDNKVLAVKRYQNYDTTENRLLKAVLKELQYLFDEKQNISKLSDEEFGEQELLETIESWLVSDESGQIGQWQNLPPNNTLLQHKHYRKIWYIYQFLQKIDDIVENDKKNYKRNIFLVLHFQLLSKLLQYKEVRVAQAPIQADFENFIIDIGLQYNHCVKGYLINNGKTAGYFTLKIHKNFYQIQLFDEQNRRLFDIQCFLSEDKGSLFELKFSIKEGEYNSHLIGNIEELIFQIMSGFKHILGKEKSKYLTVKSKNAIIDLSTTETKVYSENRNYQFGNFIAQIWNKGMIDAIYAGDSHALYVNNDVKTYSLYSALNSDKEIQSKIIPIIMQKFLNYIDYEKITCIVSDKFGDFNLQVLKQSLNTHFSNSHLLPKSIAGAFSLLADKQDVEENSDFLFIDMDNDSVIFTKLKSRFDDVLLKLGYKNLTWERYPTDIVDFKNSLNTYLCNIKNLNQDFADIIASNFSIKDLKNLNLSLLNDKVCQHIEMLNIDPRQIRIEEEYFNKIRKYINEFIKNNDNAKIIVKPDLAYIIPNNHRNRIITIQDLNKGVEFLLQQQRVLGEYSDRLWRDYLPYMGIRIKTENGYEKFDLVKDVVISPKRGQRISIAVDDIFILPKNQKNYNFPLYLGDKSQANRYQATLKSPVFPLKEDTECQVKLYYTYGAEEPYELYFITDKKDKIKAEWGLFDDSNVEYPEPEYPKPLTLEELKNFTNNSGRDRNLINDVMKVFDMIIGLENNFEKVHRLNGTIKTINKDKGFAFIKHESQDYYLKINNRNFIEELNIEDLKPDTIVSFEVFNNKHGREEATSISFSLDYPKKFYQEQFNEKYTNQIKRNQSALFKITNDVRLANFLEMRDFNEKYQQVVEAILSYKNKGLLDENKDLDKSLQKVLYCDYHCMPSQLYHEIKGTISDNKYEIGIAYLLADISKEWQKEIFEMLLKTIQNNRKDLKPYQVFGIAFWRCESLVGKLSTRQVEIIFTGLVEIIENFITKNKVKNGNFYALSKYWQLVLALLRLRNRDDVRDLFNPNNPMIEKLIDLLSKTEQLVLDQERLGKKRSFKTYIDFTLEKPEHEKSSDFFYALRLYLTGDNGANAIRIKVGDEM